MSIQLIRKNFRLAAFAVVAALGVSFMPTPAQAQVRVDVQNCLITATAGTHYCRTVWMQLQRTGGTDGQVYWDVRAKLMRPAGVIAYSGSIFVLNSNNCSFGVPLTFGPWCRIGNVNELTPLIRIQSVVVYPQ